MIKSNYRVSTLALFCTLFCLNACVTTYKTGFNTDKKQMAIDVSDHNLQYQYTKENIFEGSIQEQIDGFDKSFLNNLKSNIQSSGYSYNMRGPIETIQLKDCLIDFSTSDYYPYIYNTDSIYTRDLIGTLVCTSTSDSTRLFYAVERIPLEFQTKSILEIQNKDSAFAKGWYFAPHYAYKELPVKASNTDVLARKLARKTMTKLDTTLQINYRNKYPERYSQNIATTEASDVAKGLGRVLVVIIVVFLYLL
jgi:hypothetical protein